MYPSHNGVNAVTDVSFLTANPRQRASSNMVLDGTSGISYSVSFGIRMTAHFKINKSNHGHAA